METRSLASWWGVTIFGKLKPNKQTYLENLTLTSKEAITFGDIKSSEKAGQNIWKP